MDLWIERNVILKINKKRELSTLTFDQKAAGTLNDDYCNITKSLEIIAAEFQNGHFEGDLGN